MEKILTRENVNECFETVFKIINDKYLSKYVYLMHLKLKYLIFLKSSCIY